MARDEKSPVRQLGPKASADLRSDPLSPLSQTLFFSPIDYLLDHYFPHRRSTGAGSRLHYRMGTPGPSSAEAYLAEVKEARAKYEAMSDDALVEEIRKVSAVEATRRKQREESEERQRFFNQPAASADFAYWGRMPYWSCDEGLALCLGKDPKLVAWTTVQPWTNVSVFAAEYARRREFVGRAVAVKYLTDPCAPGAFLAWAVRNGFAPPKELLESVERSGGQIMDWQALYERAQQQIATTTRQCGEQLAKMNELVNKAQSARDAALERARILETEIEQLRGEAWKPDPSSPVFPSELDIALQAWRAVSRSAPLPDKPKAALLEWLARHYSDEKALGAAARERIALVCNWDKTGGRPSREPKE